MLITSQVTSKGQVTIPKKIRDLLGLHKSSILIFEVRDNNVTLRSSGLSGITGRHFQQLKFPLRV